MAHSFALPSGVIGPAELGVLRRNLETFNDEVHQAGLRAKSGVHKEVAKPVQAIIELAALNKADLRNPEDRQALIEGIIAAQDSAPTVTMSFATEPSNAFMVKIVQWLRNNIHPQLLVRIGLQPSIAAGCTLRTTSRIYDMSLRNKFNEQRPMLMRRLQETTRQAVPIAAPTAGVPSER
jgi:hypothetical protein